MPLSDVERAYLAGIIDGEGNVSIAGRLAAGKRYFTPVVQVTNTRRDLLEWLQQRYTGNIYGGKPDPRGNRKPAWVWVVAGQKALTVLRDARPYLLLKNEQADLLLALKRYVVKERDILGRLKGVMTDEERAENEAVVTRIRQLNKRGV